MVYLIATYCLVFVYMIFTATIKETMKRYYNQIYTPIDRPVDEYNLHEGEDEELNPNIFCGRSCFEY